MTKTEVVIREISNGWLLTIECDDMQTCIKEMHFEAFPEVLAYLHKLNLK